MSLEYIHQFFNNFESRISNLEKMGDKPIKETIKETIVNSSLENQLNVIKNDINTLKSEIKGIKQYLKDNVN